MKNSIVSFFAFMFLLIIISLFYSSCKKDSVVNNNNAADTVYQCLPNIKGLWEGTMTDAITQPFNISLKTNGTCFSENISPGTQENFSYGNWNLSSDSIFINMTCVYGYPTNINLDMRFRGRYNSAASSINGTFFLESPSGATDAGTFSISRVN